MLNTLHKYSNTEEKMLLGTFDSGDPVFHSKVLKSNEAMIKQG
jgi:hypothetical protein